MLTNIKLSHWVFSSPNPLAGGASFSCLLSSVYACDAIAAALAMFSGLERSLADAIAWVLA